MSFSIFAIDSLIDQRNIANKQIPVKNYRYKYLQGSSKLLKFCLRPKFNQPNLI